MQREQDAVDRSLAARVIPHPPVPSAAKEAERSESKRPSNGASGLAGCGGHRAPGADQETARRRSSAVPMTKVAPNGQLVPGAATAALDDFWSWARAPGETAAPVQDEETPRAQPIAVDFAPHRQLAPRPDLPIDIEDLAGRHVRPPSRKKNTVMVPDYPRRRATRPVPLPAAKRVVRAAGLPHVTTWLPPWDSPCSPPATTPLESANLGPPPNDVHSVLARALRRPRTHQDSRPQR